MKKFLSLIFAVQMMMLGVIGLDRLPIEIPIIRQLIGFIYLTFVPGILALKALRLNKISIIETLLYTVGLSLTILMFTGFFINIFYTLSVNSVLSLLCALVFLLCVVYYHGNEDIDLKYSLIFKEICRPYVLFLFLIFFIAIFGTYFENYYGNNLFLMLLFLIIGILILLVSSDRFIPQHMYPLTIFIISISLLYHYSLISTYICGYDIHHEFHIVNLVIESGRWDSNISSNTNSMLSIVALAPIYSNICDMSITWVFKIIYPFIYSLVPVGLYYIYQKQTNEKIAFFSCFFFMSVFVFYTEMLSLIRQQVAELFLVLILLLAVNETVTPVKKSIMYLLFLFSLSVSHYGLSYVFIAQLVLVCVLFYFMKKTKRFQIDVKPMFSNTLILVYFVFTISWYIYTSNSSTFSSILIIMSNIFNQAITDVFNPKYAQGINLIMIKTGSPLHNILKYLHLFCQLCISISVFKLLQKLNYMNMKVGYIIFSFTAYLFCLAGIILPYFASSLNTTRLYHITLIYLAPLFVIGFYEFLHISSSFFYFNKLGRSRSPIKKISMFLLIFLLFNSGWFYEVVNDNPKSISLSKNSMLNSGIDENIIYFYTGGGYTEQESVLGAQWLSKNRNKEFNIYSDFLHKSHVLTSYGGLYTSSIYELVNSTKVKANSYIYLGDLNIRYNLMYSVSSQQKYWRINTDSLHSNLIYSNNNCNIYLK